jgi:hypothetical protein
VAAASLLAGAVADDGDQAVGDLREHVIDLEQIAAMRISLATLGVRPWSAPCTGWIAPSSPRRCPSTNSGPVIASST